MGCVTFATHISVWVKCSFDEIYHRVPLMMSCPSTAVCMRRGAVLQYGEHWFTSDHLVLLFNVQYIDAQGEPGNCDLVQVHRPSSLPPQQRRDTSPCIQACLTCLYIALHRNHDDVTFVTNSHLDSFRLASLLEELCLVGSPVFVHALGKKHLLVFSFCQLVYYYCCYYSTRQGCGSAGVYQSLGTLLHLVVLAVFSWLKPWISF